MAPIDTGYISLYKARKVYNLDNLTLVTIML